MKEQTLKTIISIALAGAASYMKFLALPLGVLVIAMLADYITGIAQAFFAGELCSKTGIFGILKKLCYMFAVACGIIIDYICTEALTSIGLGDGAMTFFGTLVIVWLILNEVVSILENLTEIGVPLPAFLGKIADKLKTRVDSDTTYGE